LRENSRHQQGSERNPNYLKQPREKNKENDNFDPSSLSRAKFPLLKKGKGKSWNSHQNSRLAVLPYMY
jgi:hypothetical protein